MNVGVVIMVLLVLLLIGALPTWNYSSSYGYAPSGVLGALVVIVIFLVLLGKI